MGQQGARASGARPHAGRGSHHRTTRAGLRQRGRHGDGRGAARRALQPAGTCRGRPPHLGDRQRRRPDGRRRIGSRFVGRPPATGQAGVPVRRQQRDPVRRHRHHLHRGSRRTLRGLWLARADGRRRQRPRRDRTGPATRTRRGNPAVIDPGAHAYRLRLAGAGQLQGPRLAARREGRGGHQAQARLAGTAVVPAARRRAGAFPHRARPWQARRGRMGDEVRRVCESLSGTSG